MKIIKDKKSKHTRNINKGVMCCTATYTEKERSHELNEDHMRQCKTVTWPKQNSINAHSCGSGAQICLQWSLTGLDNNYPWFDPALPERWLDPAHWWPQRRSWKLVSWTPLGMSLSCPRLVVRECISWWEHSCLGWTGSKWFGHPSQGPKGHASRRWWCLCDTGCIRELREGEETRSRINSLHYKTPSHLTVYFSPTHI